MNLRRLPRHYRLVLFALAAADVIVVCLIVGVVLLVGNEKSSGKVVTPVALISLPTRPPVTVAPPTPTSTPTPIPTSTSIPTRTPWPTNTLVVPGAADRPSWPTSTPFESGQAGQQSAPQEVVEKLVGIRELTLDTEVAYSVVGHGQMAQEMHALYGDEAIRAEVDREWLLFQILGLVPPDLAITDDQLIDLYVLGIAGLYSPEKKHIFVVTEGESLLVHEYTHALQDAHFDLGTLMLDTASTDENLAVRAVVEGDATVTAGYYASGQVIQSQWEYLASQASAAEEPSTEMRSISRNAPRILSFPYYGGAYFISYLLTNGSWESVNGAFLDPPLSTEQVMHPEKYWVDRDPPQEVQLSASPGGGWQLLLEDTLGEFVLSVHLSEYLWDSTQVELAAAGWDGDRIAVWQDGQGRWLVLWQTVWDSDADAAEFEAAYRAVIPARFEGVLAIAGDAWWEASDVAVGMVREGDRVWVVWGPDRAVAEALLTASR